MDSLFALSIFMLIRLVIPFALLLFVGSWLEHKQIIR